MTRKRRTLPRTLPGACQRGWGRPTAIGEAAAVFHALITAHGLQVKELTARSAWQVLGRYGHVAFETADLPDADGLLYQSGMYRFMRRSLFELDLVRQTSIEAFQTMELPEAMILDGDHNYYTVAQELRLLAERAGDELPLLLLHDVGWPHGRRDDYFDPERIPQEYRQPIAPEAGLYPGVEGTREGGLPYHWPAAREGGPRNGVLTAIEDFVGERDDLRLAVVPAFFGLGVLWRLAAPYADELAELFDPWDRNPILERLERNRVLHLASSQVQLNLATRADEKVARLGSVLRKLLASRAFALAEQYTRLRERGEPAFSRKEIRRALESD